MTSIFIFVFNVDNEEGTDIFEIQINLFVNIGYYKYNIFTSHYKFDSKIYPNEMNMEVARI